MKTDEIVLENYFSRFGEIEDILVNKDRKTGKRKGFAFILFREEYPAYYILSQEPKHLLDGKEVICQICIPKESQKYPQMEPFVLPKIDKIKNTNKPGTHNSLGAGCPLKRLNLSPTYTSSLAYNQRNLINANQQQQQMILDSKRFLLQNIFARNVEGARLTRMRKLRKHIENNHCESNVRFARTTSTTPIEGLNGDKKNQNRDKNSPILEKKI